MSAVARPTLYISVFVVTFCIVLAVIIEIQTQIAIKKSMDMLIKRMDVLIKSLESDKNGRSV